MIHSTEKPANTSTVILVEGREVYIGATRSVDRVDVSFALATSRELWLTDQLDDCFGQLVQWRSPRAALRIIGSAALELAESIAQSGDAVTLSAVTEGRQRVYRAMLNRAGIATGTYTHPDGDTCLSVTRGGGGE